jgi:hypothetical protein
MLPATGDVLVEGQTARFTRRGLVEEYTVSMDGVQQDFLVLEKPGGSKVTASRLGEAALHGCLAELRLDLLVTGARLEQTAYGVQLVLEESRRKIAYSRVKVTDATGKELPAKIEVAGKSENRNRESETILDVVVNETDALYPVRIDPTFSDANWISLVGNTGANGVVLASAIDGAGNLYIGGEFSEVGSIAANNIAKWDGTTWSALGSGLGGQPYTPVNVWALTVSGSNVYVGGNFTRAGGVGATNIAKWDGGAWSALGPGAGGGYYIYPPYPMVSSLAVSGSNVYAAGEFGIARWDGSAWSALGSGVNDMVWALAVSGSTLYAGGFFTTAGGIAVSHIAKWDGNAWSALGSGLGDVSALAVSGNELYAGGGFTNAGGIAANYIAKWDGNAWSALGSGLDYWVSALAVSGSDVFAGGAFTNAGGIAANYIAKWDGSSWSALGSGLGGGAGSSGTAVYALAALGSNVYAGGSFGMAGNSPASFIAKWNGSAWSALGSGMAGAYPAYPPYVVAMAASGSDVYVGGSFLLTAGGIAATNIAKWNGNAWSALGAGIGGAYYPNVRALAVSGSNVYAGGYFDTAGGSPANCIAKWDGSTWSALGSGLQNGVYALAVSGGDLYAGGAFTNAGGSQISWIAKWDGSTWSGLGSGLDLSVLALAVSGSNVYAGGEFRTAGYIAKWDGNAWSALGSGMNAEVRALAVSGSDLYAGGFFTTAGGVAANYIAKWDGSAWSPLGTGMGVTYSGYPPVSALAVSGSDLYAAGTFTNAGGIAANYIAKWDGSAWSPLGSGMGGAYYPYVAPVSGLAVVGSDLYAVGTFTTAGGKVSPCVAKAIIGPPPFYFATTNSSLGLSSGQFYFTLVGPPGSNAVIFASTNLQTWTPLATNPLPGGSLNFTDTLATHFTRRFYRALLQP